MLHQTGGGADLNPRGLGHFLPVPLPQDHHVGIDPTRAPYRSLPRDCQGRAGSV